MRSVIICGLLLLSACGPVYKDFYTFLPPEGRAERDSDGCIDNCAWDQRRCEDDLRREQQQCEREADLERRLCEASKRYVYNEKKKRMDCVANCHCYDRYCADPDFSQCEQSRVFCHVACGGRVSQTTRCVSFCEDAAPPVTRDLGPEGR